MRVRPVSQLDVRSPAIALLIWGAALSGVGCSAQTAELPQAVADGEPTAIARHLGCHGVEPLNEMIVPLRSAAASGGVTCRLEGSMLHLFQRDFRYPHVESGSPALIERVLDPEPGHRSCDTWLLIGETWFVVADDEGVLAEVGRRLGQPEGSISPISPVVSYPDAPGCRLGP